VTLRLLFPQWQGAGTSSVTGLAAEFPFGIARRGYAVGSAVLAAILPPNEGPTATAPVTLADEGLEERDGIEAKAVILRQLVAALEVIRHHDPARIATLGGECAVSVAPFSELARRYGDDLAIVWIDSHPDIGTPASQYPGFHAMAVAALTGHGDRDVQELLQTTISPARVTLARLHAHRRGGRCRRVHDRGGLSPAGHALAGDSGRLPADLRAGHDAMTRAPGVLVYRRAVHHVR
jgi:arginase